MERLRATLRLNLPTENTHQELRFIMTHIHDSDQRIGAHLGGCCGVQHQGSGPSFAVPPAVEIHRWVYRSTQWHPYYLRDLSFKGRQAVYTRKSWERNYRNKVTLRITNPYGEESASLLRGKNRHPSSASVTRDAPYTAMPMRVITAARSQAVDSVSAYFRRLNATHYHSSTKLLQAWYLKKISPHSVQDIGRSSTMSCLLDWPTDPSGSNYSWTSMPSLGVHERDVLLLSSGGGLLHRQLGNLSSVKNDIQRLKKPHKLQSHQNIIIRGAGSGRWAWSTDIDRTSRNIAVHGGEIKLDVAVIRDLDMIDPAPACVSSCNYSYHWLDPSSKNNKNNWMATSMTNEPLPRRPFEVVNSL